MRARQIAVVCMCILLALSGGRTLTFGEAATQQLEVSIGTRIYCELIQQVESKKSLFQEGDKVRVRVWRDVLVDGQVVIPKGAPIDAHSSRLKTAKIAGVQGRLEISADAVRLGSGKEIPLSGGYGKEGRGNKVLSWTLFAVVAWPLIFITGKKAVLPPGTLFDAYTDAEFSVEVERPSALPVIHLAEVGEQPLAVEVLYEEIQGDKKAENLPLKITTCAVSRPDGFWIDRVNGEPMDPLPLAVVETRPDGDCNVTKALVGIKPLAKRFRKGINRFDVAYGTGDARVGRETMLDVQF